MPELTRQIVRQTHTKDHVIHDHTELPVEAPLHIEVNGKHVATLMRLPGHDRELALGFWLTEGLISARDDIASLVHCPDDPNVLRISLTHEAPNREFMAIGTACGGLLGRDLPKPVKGHKLCVPPKVLMSLPAVMAEHQPLRERVGALHGAAVFTPQGELLAAYEDVGRHNAMDKALGYCVLTDRSPRECIMLITGRGSAEMVIKAARAQIPILCTMAGLTCLGADLADQLGVTLVARMRSDHLEVIAHSDRIA